MKYRPTSGCAWITGASSGLGRALALVLARGGWTVAASARSVAELEKLAAEAGSASGMIMPVPVDVTRESDVRAAIDRMERDIGAIELAVLNAGTHRPVRVDHLDVADFRALVELNLMGTVNCLVAALPPMLARRRGHIAIVSSLSGYRGLPTAAAYGMTKAGLINMAESLQPELAAAGIKLQIVNPGFVRTPLTERNRFAMPFQISAEAAADAFCRGLAGDRFEIVFPRRLAYLMKLFRLLPYPAALMIARRLLPKD